jgi:hypothetical protein
LSDANLSGANLSGASLLNANLSGTNFSGAIWNNTTCADGSNSDYHLFGNCLLEMDNDHDGIGNNTDLDDDGDGVPDYIDSQPLNSAIKTEKRGTLDSTYKGARVQESVRRL